MGVGSIGSNSFSPYTTALNSGPTAAPQTQEMQQANEAQRVQDQQKRQDQQSTIQAGNTTPTRGQSLNITV